MIFHSRPSALVLALLLAGVGWAAAGDVKSESTEMRLERYGKDLSEAWTKFPTDAQKNVRQQTIQDITAVFTREIPRSEPSKEKKLAQVFSGYLNSLDKATDLFRVEKMKQERSSYIKGCGMAFKREWAFATDFAAERTTQKCYEILLDYLEQIRDRFIQEKEKDVRQDGYQTTNALFNELIRTAKIPDGIDHAVQMDKNIKEAKIRFPVTIEAIKVKNAPVFQLCEQAAKMLKQRAMQKQN